jgi:type I restriction enzyme S subunit
MKAKPYPKTKSSSVEWLGDVPMHWKEVSLRRFATRYSGGTPDRSNESFWDEGTIPWINSGAVNQGLVVEPSAFITEDAFRYSSAKWVRAGNLVMALAGQGKTKGMVAQMGIDSTCNQSMAAICPKPPLQARYLYWLLVSQYEHIRNMAGGEQRDGLNLEILGDIPCLKLPDEEQAAIAAYLDRETGRIDILVAKKRELIKRLKEKRSALISRTVTRGLPPAAAKAAGLPVNPKMKDSGIEWLGEIPGHWEARRLKDVGTLKGGAGFPHEEQGLEDEELAFYKVGDLKASLDGRVMTTPEHTISRETARKLRAAIIPPKSIVYAKIGAALLLNRRRVTFADCCIDNNMTAYLPDNRRISSDWAFYWLSILDFGEFMNPGAVPSFSEGYQAILPVLLPPLPEQHAIAAYLDAETSKLDALVAKVEEAVERLQEYRSALITAAVTGKIDVRKPPESC